MPDSNQGRAASLGWGLLFFADALQMWHAAALLVIHGLAGVLWGPASQLLIHDIVGPGERQNAMRLNAMAQTLVQLHAPTHVRGRVIGLYSMGSLGLRACSGITVGIIGGLIGVHWSLGLSALALLAIIIGLLAFTMRAVHARTAGKT